MIEKYGANECSQKLKFHIQTSGCSLHAQEIQFNDRWQDNTLVLSGGANGKWTPHDMRRTGATMMQALGVPSDVIDRCQNHVLAGNVVRRTYQHHDFAKETRVAWQQLGERLDAVLRQEP